MGVPTPAIITEPFGKNAVLGTYITLPIPVPTQIGVGDSAQASFNDGFPPLTMTRPNEGGIPLDGRDMNGLLYMITAYLAFIQAGQAIGYDATTQTAIGGYALGARLQQAANPLAVWVNVVAANMTNPDTGGAGWISSVLLHATLAPAAGTLTDIVLPGPSDYFYDINTAAGNVLINGIVAQRDGQRVTFSCTGVGNLALGFLAGTPANQIRASGGSGGLVTNDSMTIQYCAAVSRWVVI